MDDEFSIGMLTHRGYVGSIEFDREDGIFYGKLTNTKDLVPYEGNTLVELQKYFKEAVDDYIDILEQIKSDEYSDMLTLLKEIDEYLSYNYLTSVHNSSIIHFKIKEVLKKVNGDVSQN